MICQFCFQFQEILNENIKKRIQEDFGTNQVATESINFMQTEVNFLTLHTFETFERYLEQTSESYKI